MNYIYGKRQLEEEREAHKKRMEENRDFDERMEENRDSEDVTDAFLWFVASVFAALSVLIWVIILVS